MAERRIKTVEPFKGQVKADAADWDSVWFRGEPGDTKTPLLPKVYRVRSDGEKHDENRLLQLFRMKAPVFAAGYVPDREATDQWLFLAQHVGLPTRLLDWTESALVALYLALSEKDPILWMLNPIELNRLSIAGGEVSGAFPLTWVVPPPAEPINIGSINIKGAWELDKVGVDLPVAILPTNIHPRMSAQRSCFTVHGKRKDSVKDLISGAYLKRYEVDPGKNMEFKRELRLLGISDSTVFPDLDGLANELAEQF